MTVNTTENAEIKRGNCAPLASAQSSHKKTNTHGVVFNSGGRLIRIVQLTDTLYISQYHRRAVSISIATALLWTVFRCDPSRAIHPKSKGHVDTVEAFVCRKRERIVTRRSCRPLKGAGCGDYKSDKREMMAGEGTGRAGRRPLKGNRVPLIA
jgi:hypothetical protein